QVEPMLRIWKERKDQVRFDDPIPVDVEAAPGLDKAVYAGLVQKIEHEVRNQLQVRIVVTLLDSGSLPRSVYKNSLLAVRGAS
ncbi:MAG: hypothetical protein NTX56_15935, partial [Proteobacteria bacterium]|nr:hypothetical protein [Pseudomonadota bacterium]